MDSDFIKLLILLGFLFLFLQVGITFFRAKRKRELERKLDEYTGLLKIAGKTRSSYIAVMEKAQSLLKELEKIKTELFNSKSRLGKHRGELRESLQECRKEAAKDNRTEIDDRVLNQMKVKFGHHWKVYNSLKKISSETLARYNSTREQHETIAQEEQIAFRKWSQEKETVMRFFKEISRQIPMRHPFELLGKEE
ncbi:MAG: hypothetical protein JXQ83_15575 [Candidatus Glassbacteria bacterium]|nr:hypothetical protein [Candidatus Glassbacteria bacterium]